MLQVRLWPLGMKPRTFQLGFKRPVNVKILNNYIIFPSLAPFELSQLVQSAPEDICVYSKQGVCVLLPATPCVCVCSLSLQSFELSSQPVSLRRFLETLCLCSFNKTTGGAGCTLPNQSEERDASACFCSAALHTAPVPVTVLTSDTPLC